MIRNVGMRSLLVKQAINNFSLDFVSLIYKNHTLTAFPKEKQRQKPFPELLGKNRRKFKRNCLNGNQNFGFGNPSKKTDVDMYDKSFFGLVIDQKLAFPCILNQPNFGMPFKNIKELTNCLRKGNNVALLQTPGHYILLKTFEEILKLEELWSTYYLFDNFTMVSSTERSWLEYFEFLDNMYGQKGLEKLLDTKMKNLYKAESELFTKKEKTKENITIAPKKEQITNQSWIFVGFIGAFVCAHFVPISFQNKNVSWVSPPAVAAPGGVSGKNNSSLSSDVLLAEKRTVISPSKLRESTPEEISGYDMRSSARKLGLEGKEEETNKDFYKTKISSDYLVINFCDLPFLLVQSNIDGISIGFSFDLNTILTEKQKALVNNLNHLTNQFYKLNFHMQDPSIDMKDLTRSQKLQIKQVEREQVSFHITSNKTNVNAGKLTSVTLSPCFAISGTSLGLIVIFSMFLGGLTSTLLQNKEKQKESEEKQKESEEKQKESENI